MDFELTDEQELIREAVREFAEAEVAPIAAELDRDHRFPHELLPKMADLNLMGMPFPEKVGGAGADEVSYVIAVEELSQGVREHRLSYSRRTPPSPPGRYTSSAPRLSTTGTSMTWRPAAAWGPSP